MTNKLSSLNPQQQKAAQHTDGPALVIAGPGSGKTRVLTHRVAFLIQEHRVQPQSILAITFTNKAAGEMRTRISDLLRDIKVKPSIGTFHATCARWLRINGREIGIPNTFVIYDENDSKRALKQVLEKLGIAKDKIDPGYAKYTISHAKNSLISAAEYPKYAYGFRQELVAKIYPEYQRLLVKNNALDFDDLLFKTIQLFTERPKVLQQYQQRLQYILVDEYQDTNQAQYVLGKLLANQHKNIFVVGDMAQAIYSWRGADYRNITNFKKDYPQAVTYNLEQNYRSTLNIIQAAKEVIKNNRSHLQLNLWTTNPKGEKIAIYQASDERDEARYIIDYLENPNNSWEAAVLYRTNAQSRTLEEAFMKAGVPYRLLGGTKFYERKEIKDMLAYLALIQNPSDSVARERILSIGKRRAIKFDQAVASKKLDKTNHPLEIIDEIIKATGYLEYLDKGTSESDARIENVKELRSVAAGFDNLIDFLENVALVQDNHFPLISLQQRTEEVILTTLHSAKGLEFKTVFMVGMEENLLPHSRAIEDPSQLEEERRLCYVGMTRAKEKLHLVYTAKRLYFGSQQYNKASRFIGEIPKELAEFTTSPLISQTIQYRNLKSLRWDDDPLEAMLTRDEWDY